MRLDKTVRFLISIVALVGAQQALAQQILKSDPYVLTVEGYANVTTSIADGLSVGGAGNVDDVRAELHLSC